MTIAANIMLLFMLIGLLVIAFVCVFCKAYKYMESVLEYPGDDKP